MTTPPEPPRPPLSFAVEDLPRWLALAGLTPPLLAQLADHGQRLRERLPQLVATFLERLLSAPELAARFPEQAQRERLHGAMVRHLEQLFQVPHDQAFLTGRWTVGRLHQQAAVPLHLTIAALGSLGELLQRELAALTPPSPSLPAGAALRFPALERALWLETMLLTESHVHALLDDLGRAREVALAHGGDVAPGAGGERPGRDPLTGLFQQQSVLDQLRKQLSLANRHREVLTVALVDINQLSEINRREGPTGGDQILVQLGAAIANSIREEDVAGRWEGDGFCIVMPRTAEAQAVTVIQRVIKRFKEVPIPHITFCAGLAHTAHTPLADPDALLATARERLVEAQTAHRSQPGFYMRRSSGSL